MKSRLSPIARAAARSTAFAALLIQATAGCGSGASAGDIDRATLTGPCSPDTRVGGFFVSLFAASDIGPSSHFGGAVFDSIDPAAVWTRQSTVGACSLWTGPGYTCNPGCDSVSVCVAQDQCALRTIESFGTVTLTGFGSPRSEPFNDGYFVDLLSTAPYPPAAAAAPVSVGGDGGAYGPITLHGEGIEPPTFDASALVLVGGQDFTFSWTPQTRSGMQQIQAIVDLGGESGATARIECDLPDSGTATIDGSLTASLVGYGVGETPVIDLTRGTADSTTLEPGCVDFTVTATVERSIAASALPGP